jgi:hypothetical protein
MPDYNFHSLSKICESDRPSLFLRSVKSDTAVHHRRPNLVFLADDADEGLLIRRDKKISRENAIGGRNGQLGVTFFLHLGAMLPQTQYQVA